MPNPLLLLRNQLIHRETLHIHIVLQHPEDTPSGHIQDPKPGRRGSTRPSHVFRETTDLGGVDNCLGMRCSRPTVSASDYFDPALTHREIARRYPRVMKGTARYDARAVRDHLLKRGRPDESGFIRFAYRPFDVRWLYWEAETELLDRKRADYRTHEFEGNVWLSAAQHVRRGGR